MKVYLLILLLYPSGPQQLAAEFDSYIACEKTMRDLPIIARKLKDDSGKTPVSVVVSCSMPVRVQTEI